MGVFFEPSSLTICRAQTELIPLSDVRITSGQMKSIEDLSHKYLLTLEPDKLLSWFRREAGLTPKAQPYPLWESGDFQSTGPLAGHIMGFYLSGMSMMYQTTGDPAILQRLRYSVSGLHEAQQAGGDGYLSATRIGRHVFEDVVAGNFETSNPMINDTWEPVYIMNKIMLGLYDAFTLCGIDEAKEVMIGMADWFGQSVLDKIDHDAIQKLLVCEHGSINESFVNVYKVTNDQKYLRWAEKLNDEDMWVPLSEGRDILQGWHANTQIPKFTGFVSVSSCNGDKRLMDAATLFWDIVIKNHTWVNGSNSCGEHFFDEDAYIDRVKSYGGPESCNSVNMMRLTEALYQYDGRMDRIDYYERVLLNHILGNFDPEVGMSCYYTSMRPGHYRLYADPYQCFWCCVGTGLQAPAKLARMVYAQRNDTLLVNMFVPTTLDWKSHDMQLEQATAYPDENRSVIHIKKGGDGVIAIRRPYWAEKMTVKSKGHRLQQKKDGYIVLTGSWKDGETITITFTPRLEVKPLKKFDEYMSVQYGAYVMAYRMDRHGLTHDDFFSQPDYANPNALKGLPTSLAPTLVGTAAQIKKAIKKTDAEQLTLHYHNDTTDIDLVPFTRILLDRYVIYFPHVTSGTTSSANGSPSQPADYSPSPEQEAHFASRQLDRVLIGNAESEQKHHLEYYRSNVGSDFGQTWRDSYEGGFYMYEMKCSPDKSTSVAVRFRQDDNGFRQFDLQVDGTTIRSFNHDKPMDGVEKPLYYEEVPIPDHLTRGKHTVTIKFNAKNHSMAGGIFDLRTLTR